MKSPFSRGKKGGVGGERAWVSFSTVGVGRRQGKQLVCEMKLTFCMQTWIQKRIGEKTRISTISYVEFNCPEPTCSIKRSWQKAVGEVLKPVARFRCSV